MSVPISYATLTNGETVALLCIDIESIPHESILVNDGTEKAIFVQKRFEEILSDVFRIYKTGSISREYSEDISLEFLWTTREVSDQTFNADIQICLIIRAISSDKMIAKKTVADTASAIQMGLSRCKYESKTISQEELEARIAFTDLSSVRAIVKSESIEALNCDPMPYCYSFDRFQDSESDLSKLVRCLISYPGFAFSVQLIPTSLDSATAALLGQYTQTLSVLHNGIIEHGVGNISVATAGHFFDIYRYYDEHKNSELFYYNLIVYGNTHNISNVTNMLIGQFSGGGRASTRLRAVELSCEEADLVNNLYPLPWALNEILLDKDRNIQVWNSGLCQDQLYSMPYIVTAEEATAIFRLPVGSSEIAAGLKINSSGSQTKTYSSNVINSSDITVGVLRSSGSKEEIGFQLDDLTKHMLIVGTPGSGKTTFSVGLLQDLCDHNIPFLVIEPAKNEYRALIKQIPDIQIFTPGKNRISPFVFNPFVPPENVKLETYKHTLKTAFEAAVSMTTPLDKIFEETINNCYSEFRWLDTYTSDDKGIVFNISDFINCFKKTFDRIGYTGDAKNIGRGGEVRLKSLVNLFDSYWSIPIGDLLKKPTIIELAAIENSDEKALIISLLLLSILAYVNANYPGDGKLKNLILLEEAHVLMDTASSNGKDADPAESAKKLLRRMLAEIRSYGIGIVIADQSPRKVTNDIVALTDMKVVFRLVENEDKQIIMNSTNMSDVQLARLGKLRPGEAFFFYNKLDEPEEILTPDRRKKDGISITISDAEAASSSKYWSDKQKLLKPYPQCEFCESCKSGCCYDRRVLAREIAKRIFMNNIQVNTSDSEQLKNVFVKLPKLIKDELNDEEYSKDLLLCTDIHLFRMVKYETKIPITDKTVMVSLSKLEGQN